MEPPASQPLISPQDVRRLEAIGIAAGIGAGIGIIGTLVSLSNSQWNEPDSWKYFLTGAGVGAFIGFLVVVLVIAFVEIAPGPNDYD